MEKKYISHLLPMMELNFQPNVLNMYLLQYPFYPERGWMDGQVWNRKNKIS